MREPSGEGKSCWFFRTFSLIRLRLRSWFHSSPCRSPSWIPNTSRRGTGGAMHSVVLFWTLLAFVPALLVLSSQTIVGTVVDNSRAVLPRTTGLSGNVRAVVGSFLTLPKQDILQTQCARTRRRKLPWLILTAIVNPQTASLEEEHQQRYRLLRRNSRNKGRSL